MGDFNARVGSDNSYRERIMLKHGTGTMTDDGSILYDMCGENGIVMGGALFQHKIIGHLQMGTLKRQTDQMENRYRGRILADAGSDHNLVLVGKLTLKLRKANLGEKKKPRFDTA